MTEKWMPKAGDDVVLKLDSVVLDYGFFVDCCETGFPVLLSALKPVPVAMTVAQAALIEGCIERRHTIRDGALLWSLADLVYAVLAERAPQAPPDPVEAFLDEAHHVYHGNSGNTRESLRAVLKAYDAAGGGKS